MLRARCGPTFLLGVLCVSACSAPQMSLAEVLELPRQSLVPERFPGARRVLDGFDETHPSCPDSNPESALFGLELDVRGDVQRWLLLIQVTDPPTADRMHQKVNAPGGSFVYDSRTRRLQVTLFDADGTRLGRSTVHAPWDFLAAGFVRSCGLAQVLNRGQATEVDYRGRHLTRAEAARHMYGGFATLTAFLRIIKKNELLSSVLWRVIDRPSLLSILLHGGVTLSLTAQLTTAAPMPDAHLRGQLAALPGYRTTLRLNANDSPVLNTIMWVTDPESPYRISGGIIVVEGYRPSDAKVRFRMELLAARRGP